MTEAEETIRILQLKLKRAIDALEQIAECHDADAEPSHWGPWDIAHDALEAIKNITGEP